MPPGDASGERAIGRLGENGAVARLLVLGAGPAQLGVLAAARARGLTVIAADRDPSAPGFRYADRRAIVSIEDEPAIERLARAEEVAGIVAPGSDHAVAVAARTASRLDLPPPGSGDYCLVEELVRGPTVTVNAFSVDGRFVPLTVTDREQARAPAFGVTLAHLWPAELDPAQIAAAIATAAAAARALGVTSGPS